MHGNLHEVFTQIPMEARPMFRYWFPANAELDLDAIRRDMQEICDKGFGGAELKCEGGAHDIVELGTTRWQDAMTAAMEVLYKNGCRADFGNTAGQFIDCPAIRSLEDPRAAQELDFSVISIPEGSAGTLRVVASHPKQNAPMKGANVQTTASLVCVTAASPLADGTLGAKTLQQIPCSLEEMEALVEIPDDRPWLLFFHWKRARNETQPTLLSDGKVADLPLLDFYNQDASITFVRHWLDRLMTPRMRELGSAMHSCMFSDNVENSWQRLQWSNSREIFSRFLTEHGYPLAPFLPLLYRDGGGFIPESEPLYTTDDPELGPKVYRDYCETMTRLYIDNYIIPVRTALNEAGMRLRNQTPYGSLRQEQTMPAAFVDIPETESLWMGDSVDAYRCASGVVHMSGKKLYSSEIGANMGEANRQTWMHLMHQVERNIIGGVNLSVLHGYGYTGEKDGSMWPGWSCMAPQFSNDWGTRTPQWLHAKEVATYIARMQAIAQWGEPTVDLAVMRLSYKTPRWPPDLTATKSASERSKATPRQRTTSKERESVIMRLEQYRSLLSGRATKTKERNEREK